MAELSEAQLRLVYSLLKPAVRAAARFHVPMRTLSELLRLCYFEVLSHDGLSQREIGERFGQTPRHMRSLASRLRGDFFAAEQQVGVVREAENLIATHRPTAQELVELMPGNDADEVLRAVETLEREQRVQRDEAGRLQLPARYTVLASDSFHHRIDALNHFLDGVFRALMQRMVFDERQGTMIKTISFSALPASLQAFVERFEGELRRQIADLEEEAEFAGETESRYTLGVTLARRDD
ncbi:MAG: hypothetical protein OEZ06_03720 [Myxococcales bacterium]|nr:hypothetical protein [Myxococcales bacterium]